MPIILDIMPNISNLSSDISSSVLRVKPSSSTTLTTPSGSVTQVSRMYNGEHGEYELIPLFAVRTIPRYRLDRHRACLYGIYLETYMRAEITGALPRCERLMHRPINDLCKHEVQIRRVYQFRVTWRNRKKLHPTKMFMQVVMYEHGYKHWKQIPKWIDMDIIHTMVCNVRRCLEIASDKVGTSLVSKEVRVEHPVALHGIHGRADMYHPRASAVIELKNVRCLENSHFDQTFLYKKSLCAKHAFIINGLSGELYMLKDISK